MPKYGEFFFKLRMGVGILFSAMGDPCVFSMIGLTVVWICIFLSSQVFPVNNQ